jgi:hypothetical protein
VQAEPGQVSLNRLDGAGAIAGCVEIVVAQQPLPAGEPGLQPAEQGGAQVAAMQRPGGRGGKPAAITLIPLLKAGLQLGLEMGRQGRRHNRIHKEAAPQGRSRSG